MKQVEKKQWELVQAEWDRLLDWLSPDREEAGRKYEEIRQRMLSILIARGLANAEDLADEAFDRVTRKLPEILTSYTGNPALYFYGIVYKLLHEQKRPPAPPRFHLSIDPLEQKPGCLKKCLAKLSREKRLLIIAYYRDSDEKKYERRKKIATHLGLTDNALKLQLHRLRATLEECLRNCLGK